MHPSAICLRLLLHDIRAAASRTFWTAGSNRPMRMAMIAITTSNSISVNPVRAFGEGRVRYMVPPGRVNEDRTHGMSSRPSSLGQARHRFAGLGQYPGSKRGSVRKLGEGRGESENPSDSGGCEADTTTRYGQIAGRWREARLQGEVGTGEPRKR